jgi:hypothetical protein
MGLGDRSTAGQVGGGPQDLEIAPTVLGQVDLVRIDLGEQLVQEPTAYTGRLARRVR